MTGMGATYAILATVLIFAFVALVCVVLSFMSVRFQDWQDRRFSRELPRRTWGRLANIALVWRSTVDRWKS